MDQPHDVELLATEPDSNASDSRHMLSEVSRAAKGRSLAIPKRLGRYAIRGELGSGAMGTVLLAEDPELDRELAIKILRGHVDEHHRRQLIAEAQAMAKLAHPNVVMVYDVGEQDQQVFVAMEYVRGQTLRAWQVERHGDWRAIARVYLDAARGLEAAHLSGIVHRDFKPDNVLLTKAGVAKVTDFGLARESSPSTMAAAPAGAREPTATLNSSPRVVGTPAYLAPECFSGQVVGPRADQFAFCVSLWEALYGERPFQAPNLVRLLDDIWSGRRRPPPSDVQIPRALRKLLDRGLDKDPSMRFASMSELCAELERIKRPVVRRFAVPLVGLGLVLGVLAGAASYREFEHARCTSAADEFERVWAEEQREAVRAGLLETELSYAADTWARVDDRIGEWGARWQAARVAVCDMARDDPAAARATLCLDQQLQELRALGEFLAQADGVTTEHAVDVVAELPVVARCEGVGRAAPALPPADAETRDALRASRTRLARVSVLADAGGYGEALDIARAELARAEELGYEPLIAETQRWLGSLLGDSDEHDAAEDTLIDAYVLADRIGLAGVATDAANALTHLLSASSDRTDEGRLWSRLAADQVERLGAGAGLLEAEQLLARASLERELGQPRAALETSQRARELAEALLDSRDPRRLDFLSAEAGLLHEHGEYDEALDVRRRTVDGAELAFGEGHPKLAAQVYGLGMALAELGHLDEADAAFERSRVIRGGVFGPESVEVSGSLLALGNVAFMRGEVDEAAAYQARALAIRERALGPTHKSLIRLRINMAIVEQARGQHLRAQTLYQQALDATIENVGPDHPDVGVALLNLATVQHELGGFEDSIATSKRALKIYEAAYGPEHPSLSIVLNNLASVHLDLGSFEMAITYAERSLAIMEAKLGPDHGDLANPLLARGRAQFELGRFEDARASLARALPLSEAGSFRGSGRALVLFYLARSHDALGQRDQALELGGQAAAELEQYRNDEELLAMIDAWNASGGSAVTKAPAPAAARGRAPTR